jgi:cyclic pyranopterin phosphate synthase
MPQNGIANMPQEDILTFEEIFRLAGIFRSLGIKKIRLTGGEPLVRRELIDLIKGLRGIEGIEEICLTTNGALLSVYAEDLKKSGLDRVNISFDTLRPYRFREITRTDLFSDVMKGIDKAREADFNPIKLNMVVMKGINDDEITDFVNFARSKGLTLRFIELMNVTPLWKEDHFMPIEDVISICDKEYGLEKIGSVGSGPAVYYKTKSGGSLGFIKTDGENCGACKRLRVTSTGDFKICLYENKVLGLRSLLRLGVCDEEIRDIIKAKTELKSGVNYKSWHSSSASMCSIGG